MFIDLADSTRLTRQFEAEDARDIMLAYRRVAVECVRSVDGNEARAFGDGLLTSFGYPRAHENDAERAIRAARAIHEAMKGLSEEQGIDLKCRIGIVTGTVLIGDRAEQEAFMSDEFYGEPPTLAARLQGVAGPAETLICGTTYDHARNVYRVEPIEETLKGFEEQRDFYRVTGEIDGVGLLSNIVRPADREIVGRAAQLDTLMSKWALAAAGQGQVATVSGDAGVGKTRLLAAMRHHPALGPHQVLVYQGVEQRSETPYFPFVTQLWHWARLRSTDSMEVREAKLRETFEADINAEQMTLLLALTGVDQNAGRTLRNMPEQVYREKLLEMFVQLLRNGSADQPLLVHFEDVHWIDPSSRWLVKSVVPLIAELPVMMVLSHRSTGATEYLSGHHVSRLPLDPLTPDAVRHLIDGMPGSDALSDDAREEIVRVADGHPLFAEHYTMAVITREKTGRRTDGAIATPIPDRIYGLLFEQIDNSGDDRDLALAACAAGRTFEPEILAAAAAVPLDRAHAAIARLVEIGLLVRSEVFVEERYRFSHLLIQEAGYQSLGQEHRKLLHGRIAAHLLQARPGQILQDPGFAARQYTEAGIADKAIEMWIICAERAATQFANVEAMTFAQRGLALLRKIAPDSRDATEMQLRFLLASASRAAHGFGAAETVDAFDRALELAEKLGDAKIILRSAQGLFTAQQAHANYTGALSYATRLRDALSDPAAAAAADQMTGVALTWLGQFDAAHVALNAAIDAATREDLSERDRRAMSAIADQAMASLAVVEAFRGDRASAIARAEQAVETAFKTGNPMLIANAMLMACNTYQILRHPGALENARALQEYAHEHRLPFYDHGALSFLAVAMYREGEPAEGHRILNEAWTSFKQTATRANQVFVCVELAEGCRLLGRPEEGLAAVRDGLALVERYDERNFEAELHRLKGELLIMAGDNSDDPTQSMRRALDIARKQGAELFRLRILTRLAERTDCADIRSELQEVLSMMDTDLPDAAAARAVMRDGQGDSQGDGKGP